MSPSIRTSDQRVAAIWERHQPAASRVLCKARPANKPSQCPARRAYGPHRVGLGHRHGKKILARIDELVTLHVILFVVKLAVATVRGEELAMRATLNDPAVLHDEK